ncbi:MAG TPA: ATP-binding protein [Aggregatilinea sp.]|jgi:signal transduction histidine kinase|uniref:sensor histidine kinase n=1 Tax=Aggregatilinea sp. TaxID=2806333 RepID=UPI002CAD4CA3|nr:ATP-binding protein [Aggregatilinea sp.]HML21429.1 ATP-binding protein [Aggregatilinea sp.]
MGRWLPAARRIIARLSFGNWTLRVSLPRALIEALALSTAMMAILLLTTTHFSLSDRQNGLFIVMLTGISWYAIRLRRAQGRWWRQILFELIGGLAVSLGMGVLILEIGNLLIQSVLKTLDDAGLVAIVRATMVLVLALITNNRDATYDALAPETYSAVIISGVIAHITARTLIRIWLFWGRLRRRHLLWSLTHSHVLLVVLPTAAFSIVLITSEWSRLSTSNTEGESLVSLVLNLVPLILVYGVLLGLLLVLVVPPSIFLAYLAARRTTRRLKVLMGGAAALSAGDTSIRIPVQGEDEVAALQSNFNTMAEDLDHTMHALQSERDAVARLLRNRRELVASVSHELRTPVATLRGTLEPLLDRAGDDIPADVRRDLAVIDHETARLQHLIDDLFALSRAELGQLELHPKTVDASAVIRRTVEMAAPLLWKTTKVELIADLPDHLPPILADETRLEQIFHNLLRNGARHTPPGGIVAVSAVADGDCIIVQVKDTGEGIGPADLPHIWERFYRGDTARLRDGSGAGLGLALVKELAEAMSGTVEAESVLGQGSTFTVRLPKAAAK